MNNRLREFEKESGLEIYGLGARRDRWEHTIEKFAELIVRECMNVVRGINQEYDGGSTVVNAADEIREHFGVEE